MPLESLSQPFNPDETGRKVREVQVEHEPEYESAAEQRYEKLKNSPMYEGKLWRNGIFDGEPRPPSDAVQLLAHACEIALGKTLAPDKRTWILEKSQAVSNESSDPYREYALIDLALLHEERAQEILHEIMNNVRWRKNFISAEKLKIGDIPIRVMYAGLLLHDPVLTHIAQNDPEYFTVSHSELWDILLNIELHPAKAREQWDALRNSAHHWNNDGFYVDDSDRDLNAVSTFLQLRTVLIEARLEAREKQGSTIQEKPHEIPEERNF